MTSQNGLPTIKTFSGITFDFLNPTPDMISMADIAHALSNICRFGGQAHEFYSVAQHSILVSDLSHKYALEGLLHDASEAYLGDVVRPLKRLLPEYQKIEKGVTKAIEAKYELRFEAYEFVKVADTAALAIEGKRFMAGRDDEYGICNLPHDNVLMKLTAMNPIDAEAAFHKRYLELWER